MKYLCFVCLWVLAFHTTFAQKSKKSVQKYQDAYNYMATQKLEKGINILEDLLEDDPTYLQARTLLIMTYNMTQQADKAELHTRKAIEVEPNNPALIKFYYDVMLYDEAKGDYTALKQHGTKFMEMSSNKPNNLTASVRRMLASADYAMEGMKHPVPFNPKSISKSTDVLPVQYFPAMTGDANTIIFTGRTGTSSSNDENIYQMKKTKGEWGLPEQIKELNTDQNEGTCSVSADGKTLIFTVCQGNEERPIYGRCDLFVSYNEGGVWTTPQNMGNPINTRHYETQPSLSADGRTLYFVSDRTGGFGQEDIWVSTRATDGTWTTPRNLGSTINTAAQELSPFIHQNNKTLFFSSTGHIGYGNLDVYKTELQGVKWAAPENLGYPINDHRGQVAFVINAAGTKGYYSQGMLTTDNKLYTTLFEFDVPETVKITPSNYVKGRVFDAKTKKLLQAKIDLVDVVKDSIESTVFSDKKNGDYLIMLSHGAEYALYVQKEGYLFQSLSFNYTQNGKDVEIDIYLEQVQQGSKIVLNNIFFDFNKWNLQEKSDGELNRLLTFMQKNPTIKVEISAHTDNVGGTKFNQDLSEKRATAVVNYLKTKGIEASRILPKGYGETQPLKPNDTDENRAMNRRIEFKIL